MGQGNKFYLSFSKLSTYIKCPMRYKFIYVDELPTAPRSYFSFGNSIHKVLEEFYKEETSFKKLRKSPYNYLMELLDKHWIKVGYAYPQEERRAKEEAKMILTNFYRKSIFSYKPALLVEKEFSFELEGTEIKGRIDRIDEEFEKLTIIDYKTNTFLPQLFKEEELLQPLIYKMAVEELFPDREIGKVTFYFLKHSKKIDFEIDELLIEKGKKRMLEILYMIRNADFYPISNGSCSGCEFRSICPAYQNKKEN